MNKNKDAKYKMKIKCARPVTEYFLEPKKLGRTAIITVLRYSSAKTKPDLLKEVANVDNRDHNTGDSYDGLCVVLEKGKQPFDIEPLIPVSVKERVSSRKLRLDYTDTPVGLAAASYHTSSNIHTRTMWRLKVNTADIIGLADRYTFPACLGPNDKLVLGDTYVVDGLILRRGARVISAQKVPL